MPRSAFVIAQLSDIHCGSPHFDAGLLEAAVAETIAIRPDLVLIGGDLTTDGYANEFRMAQQFLEPLTQAGLSTVVIPGNHDSKNVGYLHFRDTFGAGDVPEKGDRIIRVRGGDPAMSVHLTAIDSSKPDLAEGEVGRERYEWIRDQFSDAADVKVFALHHHLVPVPGTGRERNTVWDAGDVLALLADVGVDLVLSGHKHVPHVWSVNGVLVVNSGTVSSHRVRGYTPPSYNIIEITPERMLVTMKYPGRGERLAAEYDRPAARLLSSPELAGMFNKTSWRP